MRDHLGLPPSGEPLLPDLMHPVEVVDLNSVGSRSRTEIAIVGAGFRGSLLALQIFRADVEVRIYLIELAAQFGCGLAYGAADYLLYRLVGRVPARDQGYCIRGTKHLAGC